MKNIIFIRGIFANKFFAKAWREELQKTFPNDNVIDCGDFYFYTQKNKLNKTIKFVEEILRNGNETIIFAHSFGGILAIAIYLKNLTKGRNNIKKIITVASPHQMSIGGLKKIKNFLGYKNDDLESVEVETYGGVFDCVVPSKYSKLKNKKHQKMKASHLSFLFCRKTIRKIINNL